MAICLDEMVSAVSVPREVYPAKWESTVPELGSQWTLNAKEVTLMEIDTTVEISSLDNLRSMEIDTYISCASASDENLAKNPPTCTFSHKNCEFFEIVANIDHVTEVSNRLHKVHDKDKTKLRIYIEQYRLDYAKGVLISNI